jgi:hypothetical protein
MNLYGGARWPSGHYARRGNAEAKHRSQRPVIGWVTKNLLSRAPPCFGRHVMLLVPATFADLGDPLPLHSIKQSRFPLSVLCMLRSFKQPNGF